MQDRTTHERPEQIKAIIIRDHKILFVRESDHWRSLPGGGIDHRKSVATTLLRELSEEFSVLSEAITVDEQIADTAVGEVLEGIPRVALIYRVSLNNEEIKKTDEVLTSGRSTADGLAQLYISPTVGAKTALLRTSQ